MLRLLEQAGRLLDPPPVAGQRLADAVDPRTLLAGPARVELQDARLDAAELGIGLERVEERRDAARLERRVGVEHEDRVRLGPRGAEVDGGGEAGVAGRATWGTPSRSRYSTEPSAEPLSTTRSSISGPAPAFSSDPRHRARCWREFQFGITTATDREALTG